MNSGTCWLYKRACFSSTRRLASAVNRCDVHVFKLVCVAPSSAESWDRYYRYVAARHLGEDSRKITKWENRRVALVNGGWLRISSRRTSTACVRGVSYTGVVTCLERDANLGLFTLRCPEVKQLTSGRTRGFQRQVFNDDGPKQQIFGVLGEISSVLFLFYRCVVT